MSIKKRMKIGIIVDFLRIHIIFAVASSTNGQIWDGEGEMHGGRNHVHCGVVMQLGSIFC